MSGVPTPANVIVEPFGKNAGGAYIQLPIPVASQIGITNGVASFNDGFVPLNMTDPTAGGIPPRGKDMNGILNMITQYCVLMQAGQLAVWDATAVAAFSGYAVGARLASVSSPGRVWTNLISGNAGDPDADSTGWYSNTPIYTLIAPSAGVHNDFALLGASDYAIDVDTAAGPIDFSGFIPQRDGQTLYLSNTNSNLMQILASSGGSTATNQIRSATDLGLVQYQTFTIKYFAILNRWLAI